MEPLYLYRENLNARHLCVKKRHDSREFIRNFVGNKQQTETPRGEIRRYVFPETLHIGLFIAQ